MKASVYYGKGDIRVESVPDPEIKEPTDALVRIMRAYIPDLMDQVLAGKIDPSPVLEMSVDLEGVPAGYAAMDARQKIKVMIKP